nr:RlmF-related methyltransferase [Iodobacter fluviatilis]
MSEKKEFPAIKNNLHPRNPHRGRYDFPALIISCPDLAPFVAPMPMVMNRLILPILPL